MTLGWEATPGKVMTLAPGLRCIIAPNPSAMTGPGTNTYLLGAGPVAVIDPGPMIPSHLAAIMAAADQGISHIIVTHSHLDHSPLARPLAEKAGAPVLAFGDTFAARSAAMARLAAEGLAGGGEGLDQDFVPDQRVGQGDVIKGQGWELTVHHTPGHLGNHIALQWEDAVFVGDTVMGWSTSLVSPPDGDMAAFLGSCEALQALNANVFYSGHGAPITDPKGRLTDLIAHREDRTQAILAVLHKGPASIPEIVKTVYQDLDPSLFGAAGRNVFAHLIALVETGEVSAAPTLSETAVFTMSHPAKGFVKKAK